MTGTSCWRLWMSDYVNVLAVIWGCNCFHIIYSCISSYIQIAFPYKVAEFHTSRQCCIVISARHIENYNALWHEVTIFVQRSFSFDSDNKQCCYLSTSSKRLVSASKIWYISYYCAADRWSYKHLLRDESLWITLNKNTRKGKPWNQNEATDLLPFSQAPLLPQQGILLVKRVKSLTYHQLYVISGIFFNNYFFLKRRSPLQAVKMYVYDRLNAVK